MITRTIAGLLIAVGLALGTDATAGDVGSLPGQPPLTVVTWGADVTRSQMQAIIQPYRKARGRWVSVETYGGGLEEIRAQVRSLNVTWDVVSLELDDAARGCKEGLLEPIDVSKLPAGPRGTPASEDFFEGTLHECAVGQAIWSTVIAFEPDRFPRAKPSSLADFFDLKRFPGPRGLRKGPRANLEWALMADGVPTERVYETLSTEDGLERALDVLSRIKTKIVWWTTGSEPVQLLESGKVVMSSAWNGGVYTAVKERGAKLDVLWDGQVWAIAVWGIVKGTNRLREAMDFVAFASNSKHQAKQAALIASGPTRRSANALVSPAIQAALPTATENQRTALRFADEWWAENREKIEARFSIWLVEGPKPYNFRDADRQ